MTHRPLLRLAALVLLGAASPLAAQTLTYEVCLTGDQENPPVATSGTGSAIVTVDTATGDVTCSGSYQNLNDVQTIAHIHFGQIGVNGGTLININATGGTTGTFTCSGTLVGSELTALLNGNTYVNIHSMAAPNGELRGQIVQLQDATAPAELPGDPTLSDGAGTSTIGPRLFCQPESFNIDLDCSGAASTGVYAIEVRDSRNAVPLTTKFGFAYLSGTKIGTAIGMHAMDVRSFFSSPMALPPDISLVGFTYHAQGFCGGFSPNGRTSNLLSQTVGL